MISLEYSTVVIHVFKFEYPVYSIFRKKSLIVLGLFHYKYWSEYLLCGRLQWERTAVESLNLLTLWSVPSNWRHRAVELCRYVRSSVLSEERMKPGRWLGEGCRFLSLLWLDYRKEGHLCHLLWDILFCNKWRKKWDAEPANPGLPAKWPVNWR